MHLLFGPDSRLRCKTGNDCVWDRVTSLTLFWEDGAERSTLGGTHPSEKGNVQVFSSTPTEIKCSEYFPNGSRAQRNVDTSLPPNPAWGEYGFLLKGCTFVECSSKPTMTTSFPARDQPKERINGPNRDAGATAGMLLRQSPTARGRYHVPATGSAPAPRPTHATAATAGTGPTALSRRVPSESPGSRALPRITLPT